MRTEHWVEWQEEDRGMVIWTFVDGERSMGRNVETSVWNDFVRPQMERTCDVVEGACGPRLWWFVERDDAIH